MYVTLSNIIVGNFWTTDQGKQAYFNGNSAWIEVPALSNVQFAKFGVSFWFKRVGNDTGAEGLLYNGDCKQLGSIRVLSSDKTDVLIKVRTVNHNITIGEKYVSFQLYFYNADDTNPLDKIFCCSNVTPF
jgi:hypothetical protein